MTADAERRLFLRWYNLANNEVPDMHTADLWRARDRTEAWRAENGLLHPYSPLVRGFVLDVLRCGQ